MNSEKVPEHPRYRRIQRNIPRQRLPPLLGQVSRREHEAHRTTDTRQRERQQSPYCEPDDRVSDDAPFSHQDQIANEQQRKSEQQGCEREYQARRGVLPAFHPSQHQHEHQKDQHLVLAPDQMIGHWRKEDRQSRDRKSGIAPETWSPAKKQNEREQEGGG